MKKYASVADLSRFRDRQRDPTTLARVLASACGVCVKRSAPGSVRGKGPFGDVRIEVRERCPFEAERDGYLLADLPVPDRVFDDIKAWRRNRGLDGG